MWQPLVLVRIFYFHFFFIIILNLDFQIRTIDIDAKRCKLQVWDTAGQDRFKCVVSSFYRGAHGVVICFDITDLDSFRNVDNWLEEIKRYCAEDTPVFLVGTKSDLQSKRMVSYATIKTYTDTKKLTYIETSSKTNENIENCFFNFTKTLIQQSNQRDFKPKISDPRPINPRPGDKTRTINSGCMGGDTCTI